MSQLQPIHAAAGRKRIRRSLASCARVRLLLVSSLLIPLVLVSVSCATKGFVRKTVAPVDHRLGEVEESSNRNLSSIAELEKHDKALQRDIDRADERAGGAEGKALDAGQLATEAGSEAENARQVADDALGRIDDLKSVVSQLDDFRPRLKRSATFDFDSSELKQAAKTSLDELTSSIGARENYVIEVRGFTDSSGSSEYNLRLSRARADAVVRYLTGIHEVPLYRVHRIGLGSEGPAADNLTREGRRQNRRVEATLFVSGAESQYQTE